MLQRFSMTAFAILAMSALAFAAEAQVAKGQVKAVSGNTITVSDADGGRHYFGGRPGVRRGHDGGRRIRSSP